MAEDSSTPEEPVLLHGDLDLCIHEARHLPNMDICAERLRRCFAACGLAKAFTPTAATTTTTTTTRNLGGDPHGGPHHPKIITSDPYVTVSLAGAVVARTRVISNDQNPVWAQRFRLPLAHRAPRLDFTVKDNDLLGAQIIGVVSVPAAKIASGALISGWFPVIGLSGKPPKPDTALSLSMQFTPVEETPAHRHGIAGDPEKLGVRDVYFPVRKGGMVTLYQDAHLREGELPDFEVEGGRVFRHGRCWEDICHAILEAHHLIYIAGWSIYDKVRLVREPTRPLPSGGELTLGELLKYKSQEGLRVCLLAWDDRTSHDRLFFKTGGVMQTHDEDTKKFFKHSSVICVLSPRYGSTKLSIFKQQIVGSLFTHHQKCVIVDTQAVGNNRKITAFIGGLDLCDGRYDTPEHRLFADLDTVFADDFHNPTFPGETKAPRQPWHDLHCKIEGPAAYDILENFEQRWLKATKIWAFGRFKQVGHWKDDALLKLERISWIVSPSPTVPKDHPSLWISAEEYSESWHVQVFRSIDSGSVKWSRDIFHDLENQNLVFEKKIVIDKSIHAAYVQAIRSAQHFIYIENQYFLGSSYAWPAYENAEAGNLIPMELALKIASKIRARERFAVYIIIPMWPEGIPSSASVQEILFWQAQTIQMMYEIIGRQLKSMNLETAHPQDYLNFYCLGNREVSPMDTFQPTNQASEKTAAALAQKNRRFMIYVHAKGMMVDDEYVILGSANINQRSLDGSRDTEIAMGAYQPHHTWAEKQRHPHGQIYGYRMSLWMEHLGMLHHYFKEPHTLECVKFVNHIADANWTRYTAEQVVPLQGHLLKYPIKVEADGKVGPLPGQESFPDVGGKVLGEPAASLPDNLTM